MPYEILVCCEKVKPESAALPFRQFSIRTDDQIGAFNIAATLPQYMDRCVSTRLFENGRFVRAWDLKDHVEPAKRRA